jgi:hypothetical protein
MHQTTIALPETLKRDAATAPIHVMCLRRDLHEPDANPAWELAGC